MGIVLLFAETTLLEICVLSTFPFFYLIPAQRRKENPLFVRAKTSQKLSKAINAKIITGGHRKIS